MTVFLPCRKGSERIPYKNTRNFSGVKGGLLKIKLEVLLKVSGVDNIVVSTNDPEVVNITRLFKDKKISIDIRPDYLATSAASTDDIVKYVPTIIGDKHIIWTHVTSPFVSVTSFEEAIELYLTNKRYDSLMTVNEIQTFLWDEKQPINYNRGTEKWPRTQTLPLLYEVNSGIFINSRENYLKYQDRIGNKPFLYVMNGYECMDIDWPKDFELAEIIYKRQNGIGRFMI